MGKLFLLIIIQGGLLICQLLPSPNLAGTAYANSVTECSEYATFTNPAIIAKTKNSFGISLIQKPFGLNELKQQNYGIIIQTRYFGIGSGYRSYGFDLYNEQKVSVGFASQILPVLYAGASFEINYLNIEKYGNANNTKINVGLIILPLKNIQFGISVRNLFMTKIHPKEISSDNIYSFGISVEPEEKIILYCKVSKEKYRKLNTCLGVKISLFDYFDLLTGYSDNPNFYSFGINFNYKFIKISFSQLYHDYLENTSIFGLTILY